MTNLKILWPPKSKHGQVFFIGIKHINVVDSGDDFKVREMSYLNGPNVTSMSPTIIDDQSWHVWHV